MTKTNSIRKLSFKSHWFWLLVFAVCAVNALVLVLDGWESPQIKEIGVLCARCLANTLYIEGGPQF